MQPRLQFLEPSQIERILAEARDLLAGAGVEIHNDAVLELLGDHGAEIDRERQHARFPARVVDAALASAPSSFRLFDLTGSPTHDFSPGNVYFTPGSAAIHILDIDTGEVRRPKTADLVRLAKLVCGLENIAAQSTALIPVDVPERIQDSYRLYLALLHCEKPVVTGAFTIGGFEVLRDLQVIVRGSAEELARKPLAILSCCPTSPLRWSDVTSQNVVDCARSSIPVEFVSMPLAGFMAPVTLVGSLVQHAAETLSGIVISQAARPGAPMLYGGSPAVFDMRYETTPMGAIETMMLDCGIGEIGRHLGLPTQGYISLSDAKLLDAQAGLETGIGAVLAALSGINSISGPGMLDFESCQSLEKLVLDDEICGMAQRLRRGVVWRDEFPLRPLFDELLREQHLLIADHTRRHLREEIRFPGPVIDRANRARWQEGGAESLGRRAAREVERLVDRAEPPRLAEDSRAELARRMLREARRFGMDALPAVAS